MDCLLNAFVYLSIFSLTKVSLLSWLTHRPSLSEQYWGGEGHCWDSCRDVLICGDDVPELLVTRLLVTGSILSTGGATADTLTRLTRADHCVTTKIPHQPFNQKPAICKSVDYWSRDLSSQFTASVSKAIMSVWMSWGYHINSLQSRNKCLKQYIL